MAEAVLSNRIILTGLLPAEIYALKKALTLPNPKYAAAKKYSPYAVTSIPQYLTYYVDDHKGHFSAPIGFDVSKYADITSVEDKRTVVSVEYPPFLLELRAAQKEAAEKFMDLNQPDYLPQGIVCLPTGGGKTILALYVASVLKQRALVIAHKNDLILGWQKDIKFAFDGKIKPGLLKAESRAIGEQITIATVQTLSKMGAEEKRSLFDKFGLVITDEMHHCPANTYSVIDSFGALYKMFLSATPERSDGLTRVMFFYGGGFAYKYKYSSVMENNSPILPVEVVVKKSTVKFRPQVTEGNVYNILDNAIMADRQFANLVMSDIIREAKQGHSCVVFLSQKKHCLSFYNELVSCLGNTVQLYYGDSKESDEVILSRAESKESLVTITTYSKGTEGTNCKSWEVAFLVSSLNSAKNTEQAVGRIRRAKEGKLNPVRVYDYRHPDVHIIKYHGFNRDARYSKLGFRINRSFDTING